MKLIKISFPGFEKEFNTEQELKLELYNHICSYCCRGYVETDEETGEEIYKQDPVNEYSTLGELLSTACGCEFMVE